MTPAEKRRIEGWLRDLNKGFWPRTMLKAPLFLSFAQQKLISPGSAIMGAKLALESLLNTRNMK